MTIDQKPAEPIQKTQTDITTPPTKPVEEEEDWLAGVKACDRDNPECEACQ